MSKDTKELMAYIGFIFLIALIGVSVDRYFANNVHCEQMQP